MIAMMKLVMVWYSLMFRRGPNSQEAFNAMMFLFLFCGITVGFILGMFMGRL